GPRQVRKAVAPPQELGQPLAHEIPVLLQRVEHRRTQNALAQALRAVIYGNDAPHVQRLFLAAQDLELWREHLDLASVALDATVEDEAPSLCQLGGEVGLVIPDRLQHPRGVEDPRFGDQQPAASRWAELADVGDGPPYGFHRAVRQLVDRSEPAAVLEPAAGGQWAGGQ